MDAQPFDAEMTEIAKIDYLLDGLARAVERGEVHRLSYDLMEPRYLERRADLVARVTGVPRAVTLQEARPVVAPILASRPARVVDWPTVLLFLGAFLVIVASAIFSVAVWGDLGTTEKFGFLALLTASFYGAGWWAYRRLKLEVGAIALAAVASGMLLFDGWILIDGYGWQGPLPWAILLLVCSSVYFVTEVLLAGRLFGITGAAAQVAWWWLLGDGIGLPESARLAGIALVGLVWQVAAERARGRAPVRSLATVLAVAAPAVAVSCAIGVLADLAVSGPATAQVVAAAGVVGVCSGLVLWRAQFIPRAVRGVAAVAVQAPLAVAGWSAAIGVGHEWWIAAVFGSAAVVYYAAALRPWGVGFAAAGLAAEAFAVLEACLVLEWSATTVVVVIAGLAATWALAARIAERLAHRAEAPLHMRTLARVVEGGSMALLAVSSFAIPLATWTLPLPGYSLGRTDVLGYVGVLAAWWASVLVRPRGVTAFAGSCWSFVTLGAVLAWRDPAPVSFALFAAPLVGLAAVWRISASWSGMRHGAWWAEITAWAARCAGLLISVTGLVAAVDASLYSRSPEGLEALAGVVVLAVVASGFFIADALLSRSEPVAAIAAAVTVGAATLAFRSGALTFAEGSAQATTALSAGMAAVSLSGAALVLRSRAALLNLVPWAVVPAATTGSVLVAVSGAPGPVAGAAAWLLVGVAWAVAARAAFGPLAGAAGAAVIAAAWSLAGDPPNEWALVALVGVAGLGLGCLSYVKVFGPGGKHEVVGTSLALVGVLAHILVAGSLGPGHPVTAVLLVLAVNTIAASAIRRFEPGYYAAGLPLVLAMWSEVSLLAGPLAVLYSTPLALYLVGCGYLLVRLGEARRIPVALDALTAVVGLGYPVLAAVTTVGDRSLAESLAAVVVSLVAIAGGIAGKVRWYFFGGVTALASVALYRSFWAIAEYWWLVLGIVGVALLVIALTWQRQRLLVADARSWLARSFLSWR